MKENKNTEKFMTRLYVAHHEHLIHYAFYYLKNEEEAEDVVSEAFLSLLLHLEKTEKIGIPEEAYLFRVVKNEVMNHFRKQKRNLRLMEKLKTDEEKEPYFAADSEMERTEEAMQLLDTLRPIERRIVWLFYYEQLSYRTIAEMTGKDENYVGVILHRARKKIKEKLEKS